MQWLTMQHQFLETYVKFALLSHNSKQTKIGRVSLPECLCLEAVTR